jgi:hypothetical protein
VGLGKTVEAGLVARIAAAQAHCFIVIAAPPAMTAQWKDALGNAASAVPWVALIFKNCSAGPDCSNGQQRRAVDEW